MNFGEAIAALKDGKRVQRSGWNGKGMWLALTVGTEVTATCDNLRHATDPASSYPSLRGAARALALAEWSPGEAGTVRIGSHIDMRAADGSLVIGWLASQTDMLAEDWSIVE